MMGVKAAADLMLSGPIETVAFLGFVCLLVAWIIVAARSATAVLRAVRSA